MESLSCPARPRKRLRGCRRSSTPQPARDAGAKQLKPIGSYRLELSGPATISGHMTGQLRQLAGHGSGNLAPHAVPDELSFSSRISLPASVVGPLPAIVIAVNLL